MIQRFGWFFSLATLAIATVVYGFWPRDPWQNAQWVERQARRVMLELARAPANAESLAFLEGFCAVGQSQPVLVAPLLRGVREHHPELLSRYAALYAAVDFPAHRAAAQAGDLAALGGDLLKADVLPTAALCFAAACQRGSGEVDPALRGEWAFFSGYAYERAGRLESAIGQYQLALAEC